MGTWNRVSRHHRSIFRLVSGLFSKTVWANARLHRRRKFCHRVGFDRMHPKGIFPRRRQAAKHSLRRGLQYVLRTISNRCSNRNTDRTSGIAHPLARRPKNSPAAVAYLKRNRSRHSAAFAFADIPINSAGGRDVLCAILRNGLALAHTVVCARHNKCLGVRFLDFLMSDFCIWQNALRLQHSSIRVFSPSISNGTHSVCDGVHSKVFIVVRNKGVCAQTEARGTLGFGLFRPRVPRRF